MRRGGGQERAERKQKGQKTLKERGFGHIEQSWCLFSFFGNIEQSWCVKKKRHQKKTMKT